MSELYKKSYEKIEKEKKDILKKVKAEGDAYLAGINKKIEKVIKDLRDTNATKETIKESKKIIEEVKTEVKNIVVEKKEPISVKKDFVVGDFVGINNSSTVGKIIEINKQKCKATILSGTIKLQVKLDELFETKERSKSEATTYNSYTIPRANYRLDIRGEKPEVAEFEIIKFLDKAYQSSLERVEVLHGKGTGTLKKTVWDILKKHEKVKNHYFAQIEFGGEGITIVELK